jgi:type IV secretion system protein VirD4
MLAGAAALLALAPVFRAWPGLPVLLGACWLSAALARGPGGRPGWGMAAFTLACAFLAGAVFAGAARVMFSACAGQPTVVSSWLSARPLHNPANKAGRIGLWLGAGFGVWLAWGVRKMRLQAGHGPGRVHGLEVAADRPEAGTGGWGGERDVADVCEFGPPRENAPRGGGVVLGMLDGRIVRAMPEKSPLAKRASHGLAVAGTGGGKSYNFAIPNVVAGACAGESLVVTDPKGELTALLAPWLAEKMGYAVYVFNLADPQHSSLWNPLFECAGEEEFHILAHVFVTNAVRRDSSGFFVALEIQALAALWALLRADFPESQAHPRSALSLLSWPKEALAERFERAFRAGRLGPEGYEAFRGAASHWENAVAGLTSKLAVLRTPGIARLLSRRELDLSLFGREKAALFCVLPIKSEHLKPVTATFYHFLFDRLYSLALGSPGGRLPRPVRFILDEFPNLGRIPGFAEIMSTARGLGITVLYILQEIQQLSDGYSGQDKTILGNTFTKIYLGGAEAPTRRYFSSELGTAPVWVPPARDPRVPREPSGRPEERKLARRPLMTPEELGRLPDEDCVVLLQGHRPLYLKKAGWHLLPQAREIRALAARTAADVVPERPELRVELPPWPEEAEEPPEKPERRRGKKPAPPEPGDDLGELAAEELGI